MSIYFKGNKVGNSFAVGPRPTQTKNATPTTSQQVISPDAGYELSSVTVEGVTSAIDNNIQSANIKDGVNILGVAGSVIEYNPTRNETITPSTTQQIVSSSSASQLNSVTVDAVNLEVGNATPTTSQQTLLPTSPNLGFSQVTVDAVTSSIDANITAENIKNGVSILGVTGNYQGGGDTGVEIPIPSGAVGTLYNMKYNGGYILVYAMLGGSNSLYIYDTTTQINTFITSGISFGSAGAIIISVIEDKAAVIYNNVISGSFSNDVWYLNLINKTGIKLCAAGHQSSIPYYQSRLVEWTNGVYTFASRVQYSGAMTTTGCYHIDIDTDTITLIGDYYNDGNLYVSGNKIFNGLNWYDTQTNTFGNVDISSGTGVASTYNPMVCVVSSLGSDILLLGRSDYTDCGCGYYVISENKSYPFGAGSMVLGGKVVFSNNNCALFRLTNSGTQGLYFFDSATKTFSTITSTGDFRGGNLPNNASSVSTVCYFENDVLVMANNAGELVEVHNDGTNYISSVTIDASNPYFNSAKLNGKLYFTKRVANWGIWEYDFTTHTATQILSSNGSMFNIFEMGGDIYLSASSGGLHKLDIANQTTTQVYNGSGNYYGYFNIESDYNIIFGNGYKLVYRISTQTFTTYSTDTTAMGTNFQDIGDYIMIYYSPIYNYISCYSDYLANQSNSTNGSYFAYNKPAHNFASIGGSMHLTVSPGDRYTFYDINKILYQSGSSAIYKYAPFGSGNYNFNRIQLLSYSWLGGTPASIKLVEQTNDFNRYTLTYSIATNLKNKDEAHYKFTFATDEFVMEEYIAREA